LNIKLRSSTVHNVRHESEGKSVLHCRSVHSYYLRPVIPTFSQLRLDVVSERGGGGVDGVVHDVLPYVVAELLEPN
jgi:hypothetical protein